MGINEYKTWSGESIQIQHKDSEFGWIQAMASDTFNPDEIHQAFAALVEWRKDFPDSNFRLVKVTPIDEITA